MKLPITDEFLWELFHLSQEVEDLFLFLGFGNWRETFVPPDFSIRRLYEKRKAKKSFNDFINYLKRKGYIKAKALEPNQGVIITKKGLEKILKIALKKTEKKRRKDGKWIMVVFDIPERKRKLRDLFRENLQILGFKFFQKSTWVCPFDVLKELEGIIQPHGLEDYVRIFLIEEIELRK